MAEPVTSPEQQEWLRTGLANGWIKTFCLTHDTGLFADEFEQVEAEGDPCFTALRLVESEQHRLMELD
jgi:hypothetical protein